MDPQDYERLARETQTERVVLMLRAMFARARLARADSRAKIAASADLIAVGQEWTAVPEPGEFASGMPRGGDATQNGGPEAETRRAEDGVKIGLPRKRRVFADFRNIVRAPKR